MLTNPLFKFLSSLKLAVLVLLSLAGVLATATVLESEYGTRAAYVMVYGTAWFYLLLFLLGLNVLCAALSRLPWKKRHIGFVVTHGGIITILVGSYLTMAFGVDGSLPVFEGSEDSEVILTRLKLSVADEEERLAQHFPVPEYAMRTEGHLMDIALTPHDKLVVEEFVPRAVAERKIVKSPLDGVGQPALRVEVFNNRFRVGEWLMLSQPEAAQELGLGPAKLSFRKLWSKDAEARFLNEQGEKKAPTKSIGYLVVVIDGKQYRVEVDGALKKWQPVGSSGYEVQVDKYLPYAVVEDNELVNRAPEPVNPTVQLRVANAAGTQEKHTVFANFPEFTTRHRTAPEQKPFPLQLQFISAQVQERSDRMAKARGELRFAQTADDGRLLYQVRGSEGKINARGEVKLGQPVATGWMDLQFQVTEWLPTALEHEVPRYVERIQAGGESNFMTGIRLRQVSDRQPSAAVDADGDWLLEGSRRGISVGDKKLVVRYGKERLTLPFRLFLEKFTIGNDPGTTKAASYNSDVVVHDSKNGVEQKAHISMNEPLVYGGYTFYQASYQLQENGPPISVFSVNYDPGRWVKYLGSIIMVLGIILMFYFNPHYWDKMLGTSKKKAVSA